MLDYMLDKNNRCFGLKFDIKREWMWEQKRIEKTEGAREVEWGQKNVLSG